MQVKLLDLLSAFAGDGAEELEGVVQGVAVAEHVDFGDDGALLRETEDGTESVQFVGVKRGGLGVLHTEEGVEVRGVQAALEDVGIFQGGVFLSAKWYLNLTICSRQSSSICILRSSTPPELLRQR